MIVMREPGPATISFLVSELAVVLCRFFVSALSSFPDDVLEME